MTKSLEYIDSLIAEQRSMAQEMSTLMQACNGDVKSVLDYDRIIKYAERARQFEYTAAILTRVRRNLEEME